MSKKHRNSKIDLLVLTPKSNLVKRRLYLTFLVVSVFIACYLWLSGNIDSYFYRISFAAVILWYARLLNKLRMTPKSYVPFWSDLSETKYWTMVAYFMGISQIMFFRSSFQGTLFDNPSAVYFYIVISVAVFTSGLMSLQSHSLVKKIQGDRTSVINQLFKKTRLSKQELDSIHPLLVDHAKCQYSPPKTFNILNNIMITIVGIFLASQASEIVDWMSRYIDAIIR